MTNIDDAVNTAKELKNSLCRLGVIKEIRTIYNCGYPMALMIYELTTE